jgi:hypothetical protein
VTANRSDEPGCNALRAPSRPCSLSLQSDCPGYNYSPGPERALDRPLCVWRAHRWWSLPAGTVTIPPVTVDAHPTAAAQVHHPTVRPRSELAAKAVILSVRSATTVARFAARRQQCRSRPHFRGGILCLPSCIFPKITYHLRLLCLVSCFAP